MNKKNSNTVDKHNLQAYRQDGRTAGDRVFNRELLYRLFRERPMPDDQLLVSLGLYMRSSALTKILFINELYEQIVNVPGVIMEFGTWWGQNLVLYENLRGIYEPFNYDRRVIGFDTFDGYENISEKDQRSDIIKEGGYTVSENYDEYLRELLNYHERENVLFFNNKDTVVKGDATKTLDKFLNDNPYTIVALAYFDMALYEPTKACLQRLERHLFSGSIVMLDELNSPDLPGETLALMDTWGLKKYRLTKSRFMPGRSYLKIE